jgi:hypothetical protein
MNRSADFASILSFTSTPQNYGNFFRNQSFRDVSQICVGERPILSVNGNGGVRRVVSRAVRREWTNFAI